MAALSEGQLREARQQGRQGLGGLEPGQVRAEAEVAPPVQVSRFGMRTNESRIPPTSSSAIWATNTAW